MKRSLLSLALVAGLAMTGCGSGEENAEATSDSTVTIGMIPVADCAPVYIAMEEGYFEEEGINIETQTMQNASSIAPSVINGQLQYGCAATTPLLAGVQQGLDIVGVANLADVAPEAEDDVSGLLTSAGSDITRPRDLEGKTVGVNGLGSILHVSAAAVIKADGGDPEAVQFVAMSFPDMASAVSDGTVDAVSVVEPFTGMAEENGGTLISPIYHTAFTPGGTMAMLFTERTYAEENAESVAAIQRALEKASETATEDPQKVRDILVEHGGMDEEVAANTGLPPYSTEIDEEAVTQTADAMVDTGFLKDPIDASELVMQ